MTFRKIMYGRQLIESIAQMTIQVQQFGVFSSLDLLFWISPMTAKKPVFSFPESTCLDM